MKALSALATGIIFGSGLTISGMTDRSKVLGFLDLFGQWDASLAFVMAAALLITVPGYYLIQKRSKPICETQFHLPSTSALDRKLIFGAVLFGVGWGLYGYCPGPAIAALSSLQWEPLIFVGAMLTGMFAADKLVPILAVKG